MKDRLKIAIYSGDIPSTTFIERLINGLSLNSCEIYVFGFLKSKVKYKGDVSIFAYRNTRAYKLFYLLKYTLLLTLFKNREKRKLDGVLKSNSKNILLDKVKSYPVLWHKPDIFHLQWVKGLESWMWVQDFGIKLVVSLRGAHINYSPLADLELAQMYRKNFRKVDGFHAVSKAIASETQKYEAPKSKIKVVYSGLSSNNIGTARKTLSKDIIKIISVGRAHWKKGYSYALDACKILKNNNFKFIYTVVGASNSVEYKYQVKDLNLTEEVALVDNLPFSDVQKLMKQSDILLLPSVEEGVANVVLEAMGNKTLVLTTDCGGMNEVIKDGENGFIVSARDCDAIAQKINEIANFSEEHLETIRTNALETIKVNHSNEQMVNGMLELYQSL